MSLQENYLYTTKPGYDGAAYFQITFDKILIFLSYRKGFLLLLQNQDMMGHHIFKSRLTKSLSYRKGFQDMNVKF